MNQSFVQIQEDCLKVRVLLGQFEFLSGVRNLDAFAPTQNLDVLVEVLPVKVHQISRLVLL